MDSSFDNPTPVVPAVEGIGTGTSNEKHLPKSFEFLSDTTCRYDYREAMQVFEKLSTYDAHLADMIASKDIIGAHTSTSGSLLGVLDHGLRPQGYLKQHGIPLLTGMNDIGSYGLNQHSVSAELWYKSGYVVEDYSWYSGVLTKEKLEEDIRSIEENIALEMKGSNSKLSLEQYINNHLISTSYNRLIRTLELLKKVNKTGDERTIAGLVEDNFPILYLINGTDLTSDRIVSVTTSSGDEFAVKDGLNQSELMILVPEEKLRLVRAFASIRESSSVVHPIEGYLKLEQKRVDQLREFYKK